LLRLVESRGRTGCVCVCVLTTLSGKRQCLLLLMLQYFIHFSLHRSGHRIAVTWPTNPIEMWTFRIDFKMVKLCTNEKEVC